MMALTRSWFMIVVLQLLLILPSLADLDSMMVTDLMATGSTQLSSSDSYSSPRSSSENRGYGPESVKNWSGFITVTPHRHLWYWMFESRHEPATDPLILWMTGGPGCSSLIALFMENGPYKINPSDLSLELNPYSWNTRANIIYIDQPVNTGYSYSRESDTGPLTQREIAKNLEEFLRAFLALYPKYRGLELFLFGESYAGHFVPALAARIVRSNGKVHPKERIKLVGIGMGNPLVDPHTQYRYYGSYALDHHVISQEQYDLMQTLLPGCISHIEHCSQNSTSNWHECLRAHVMCLYTLALPVAYSGVNVYNVKLECGQAPLCYDMSAIDRFLAQDEVISALGTHHKRWKQCNTFVNQELALAGDWMLNFAVDLPHVLKDGVRVLVYAGEDDYICNWYGNQAWMDRLEWSGQFGFQQAPNTTWVVNDAMSGSSRTYAGLTFVRVKNAGSSNCRPLVLGDITAPMAILNPIASYADFFLFESDLTDRDLICIVRG